MCSLIEFIQRENFFQGTASELAEKLIDDIKPNVISRKLKRYEKELEEIGIEFLKFRTGVTVKYKSLTNPFTAWIYAMTVFKKITTRKNIVISSLRKPIRKNYPQIEKI